MKDDGILAALALPAGVLLVILGVALAYWEAPPSEAVQMPLAPAAIHIVQVIQMRIVVVQTQEDKPSPPERVGLGEFKLYAYCPCVRCCGKSDGITATGTLAEAGRTVAVDPAVIPLGSRIYVEGLGEFVAEDTGGGIDGRVLDIFYNDHREALEFGVQRAGVWILDEGVEANEGGGA